MVTEQTDTNTSSFLFGRQKRFVGLSVRLNLKNVCLGRFAHLLAWYREWKVIFKFHVLIASKQGFTKPVPRPESAYQILLKPRAHPLVSLSELFMFVVSSSAKHVASNEKLILTA